MKKITLFITSLLFSALSFSACSSSTNGSNNPIIPQGETNPEEGTPEESGEQGQGEEGQGEEENPPEDDDPTNYKVIDTFSKRMPAEFEPVSMVKVVYPNMMPLSAYKTISEDIPLLVLVNPDNSNKSRISKAKSEFANAGITNATYIDMPLDYDYAAWVRDFSPFYVFDDKSLTAVDFTYNRNRYEQNAAPKKIAEYLNIPYSKMNITHTGGNLMQDGRGTAFSDDLVVSENGNNKSNVINKMKEYTGTDNYVITIDPQGDYIAHIDCWAKIVAPDKIIVAKLPKSNSRYQYYEDVAKELANTTCAYGYKYKIYRVEEPGGTTIAPYTNSLIVNNNVYMPLGDNETYNQKALAVYKEALPSYNIKGIKGYNSGHNQEFLNTDALHCRTHEIPNQDMLFIDSREVYQGSVTLKDEYVVKTNIVSYASKDVYEEDVNIYYSINDGEYVKANMNQYKDTTNFTFSFTNLTIGDDVKYYIEATDSGSNYSIDPTCGKLDPHHFTISA